MVFLFIFLVLLLLFSACYQHARSIHHIGHFFRVQEDKPRLYERNGEVSWLMSGGGGAMRASTCPTNAHRHIITGHHSQTYQCVTQRCLWCVPPSAWRQRCRSQRSASTSSARSDDVSSDAKIAVDAEICSPTVREWIHVLVDVSLSETLNPELLPVAVSTIVNAELPGLCDKTSPMANKTSPISELKICKTIYTAFKVHGHVCTCWSGVSLVGFGYK